VPLTPQELGIALAMSAPGAGATESVRWRIQSGEGAR
jgi:hypothetical protein